MRHLDRCFSFLSITRLNTTRSFSEGGRPILFEVCCIYNIQVLQNVTTIFVKYNAKYCSLPRDIY